MDAAVYDCEQHSQFCAEVDLRGPWTCVLSSEGVQVPISGLISAMDAPFTPPSLLTTVAFLGIVAAVWGFLVVGSGVAAAATGQAPGRWRSGASAFLGGWALVTGAALGSGLTAAALPLSVMAYFGLNQAVALGFAFSPVGRTFARGLPLWALAGFHAFRLPLEVVLHAWYEGGTLPVQMTWSGHNLDVATGVLGLVLGLVLHARRTRTSGADRRALGVFTGVGLVLLGVVATIAVTSTPGPLRLYPNDPPVLLAFYFPYGWIVPFAVSAALFMHVVAIRRLLQPSS